MAIPETQLETWAHQGAIAQSRDTYATVKRALEAPAANYAGKEFGIFLQGSYGNDTNIYAESDVDVVIRLDSIFYHDTSDLSPKELALFNAEFSPGTYPYEQYKDDVLAVLRTNFGAQAVRPANRAIKIAASNTRRSADVVVAAQFRRYRSAGLVGETLGPQYEQGICFFANSYRIVNYPKQHSANCTEKHQRTNGWFKPTVRIFKNMRSRLVSTGAIPSGSAPSYFIEGLLYNVPDEKFGKTYDATFVSAVKWLLQASHTEFVCANKQHYLVRDSTATSWPCNNYDSFLKAVVKMWNNWT